MKRYTEGEPIYSLDEIAKQEFIFSHGKLYHKGWFMSWQARSLMMLASAGYIRKAILKDKED